LAADRRGPPGGGEPSHGTTGTMDNPALKGTLPSVVKCKRPSLDVSASRTSLENLYSFTLANVATGVGARRIFPGVAKSIGVARIFSSKKVDDLFHSSPSKHRPELLNESI